MWSDVLICMGCGSYLEQDEQDCWACDTNIFFPWIDVSTTLGDDEHPITTRCSNCHAFAEVSATECDECDTAFDEKYWAEWDDRFGTEEPYLPYIGLRLCCGAESHTCLCPYPLPIVLLEELRAASDEVKVYTDDADCQDCQFRFDYGCLRLLRMLRDARATLLHEEDGAEPWINHQLVTCKDYQQEVVVIDSPQRVPTQPGYL